MLRGFVFSWNLLGEVLKRGGLQDGKGREPWSIVCACVSGALEGPSQYSGVLVSLPGLGTGFSRN